MTEKDSDLVRELWTAHADVLWRWLARMTRDPEEADEIFQQTWLRVCAHIGRYEPTQGGGRAWLFRIAYNLVCNEARRQARNPADPLEAEVPIDSSPCVGDTLDREEALAALQAGLIRLPVQDRALLCRYYLGEGPEQETLAEIADSLGMPLGTLGRRLSVARDRLRKILTEQSTNPRALITR